MPGRERATWGRWAACAVALAGCAALADEERPAWRGTTVLVGGQVAPPPFVNGSYPQLTDVVGLSAAWRFRDALSVRAHLFARKLLVYTLAPTEARGVELSDLFLEAAWWGWTEPRTGVRGEAELRLGLPTSSEAAYNHRYLDVGPWLALSRRFPVLAGLSVSYGARFVWHAGGLRVDPAAAPWSTPLTPLLRGFAEFASDDETPRYDWAWPGTLWDERFTVRHGAAVRLLSGQRWCFTTAFLFEHAGVAPLGDASQYSGSTQLQTPGWQFRVRTTFLLAAGFTPVPPLTLQLALATPAVTGPSGAFQSPLFNVNSWISLSLRLNVEALLEG